MKKILAILMTAAVLTGCTPLLPSAHGDIPASDTVVMSTQYPVYDEDIDRIQVILRNGGETNLEYGTEWEVEVLKGGGWQKIPFRSGYGWTQPLLTLMPGGVDTYFVSMEMLDYDLCDGQYRVVKEISDTMYAAEFAIGESDVSADTPFGYVPLEDLPMDYSAEDAAADGVVVLQADGTFLNKERAEAFLQDVFDNVSTQIRFAYSGILYPDKLILEDITLQRQQGRTPCFCLQQDFRRGTQADEIETKYYSYLTAENGDGFYLTDSNAVTDASELLFVLSCIFPEDEDWIARTQAYAGDHFYGITAWSPDGTCHVTASLDDALTFFVNAAGYGYTTMIPPEHGAVRIREFVWVDDKTVMILCDTAEDRRIYYGTFDIEQEKILHHSTSVHGYTWEDGRIVILD